SSRSAARSERIVEGYNRRMRRTLLILVTFLTAATAMAARFDELFIDKTMRVDYFHTGNKGQEIISMAGVLSDGPWAGSRTRLVETLNLGAYEYDVIDHETNQVIFSRGFASVFGEWESTDEAKTTARTFGESVRFPWPKKSI